MMEIIFGRKRNKTDQRKMDKDEKRIERELPLIQEEQVESSQRLSQKAGFLSLKDRIQHLTEQKRHKQGDYIKSSASTGNVVKNTPQYATLQELFSCRSRSQRNGNTNQDGGVVPETDSSQSFRKTKIPVMKLSKDDWNVKCWEERLTSHKRRRMNANRNSFENENINDINRPKKPERQVEVFRGRIKDVAIKLDKVREGVPLDEELYQLSLNKLPGRGKDRSSREWTDLLKQELAKDLHSPRQQRDTSGTRKSPLGRPIGRIVGDDDDDD